jgi:putative chitinase
MNLTDEIIMVGCGCSEAVAAAWLPAMVEACERFQINNPMRVAAFLSNVGVESDGLTALVEDLNYDAPAMAKTWPTRYAENPHGVVKVPNTIAYELAHRPERIANNVYQNRMGNGNERSGDGWKYRGRGPFRITGKLNITTCGAAIGMDLVNHPELLEEPEAGALSAAWLFYAIGLNEMADEGDINGIIERICGSMPCDANKGPQRLKQYERALALLEKMPHIPEGQAATKAPKISRRIKPPAE